MPTALQHLAIQAPLPESIRTQLRQLSPDLQISVFNADALQTLSSAQTIWTGPLGINGDQLLQRAPDLRWLQSFGAGVEDWLSPAFVQSPVLLTNARGIHASQMAEQALALMLAQSRQLAPLIRGQSQPLHHPRLQQFELQGQSLLLVGLGHIGHAIAQRAAAFGLKVTGIRRQAPSDGESIPPYLQQVLPFDALNSQLPQADHVLSVLPLTAETYRLFDAQRFKHFKTGAYFYNLGRGASVDTQALLDALQHQQLAGAGLDVTEPEPLPAAHPLRQLPQVILTAHTGGATPHYRQRALQLAHTNLQHWLANRPLINQVDKQAGY